MTGAGVGVGGGEEVEGAVGVVGVVQVRRPWLWLVALKSHVTTPHTENQWCYLIETRVTKYGYVEGEDESESKSEGEMRPRVRMLVRIRVKPEQGSG